MNFDELYQQILEEKKKCDNPCLICRMNLKDDFIKLPCTHSYHSDCLFKKYGNGSQYSIECPYCRQIHNVSKYINKCVAIISTTKKKCNKNTLSSNLLCKKHKNYKPNNCKHVLKSGKNKGNECNKAIHSDEEFCKKHLNLKKDKYCTFILTRGINKGKLCNKNVTSDQQYCKNHIIKKEAKYCQGICKSGKNKGNKCTSKASIGDFCKRHVIVNIVI
jgi:hypothetical protein